MIKKFDLPKSSNEWIFCNAMSIAKHLMWFYLLDCHVCGSQYVGENVQPFNKRMNGHRRDLTKKTLLPVSQHFVSPGHSLDDFGRSNFFIIDYNLSWKENQRQKRESFWIVTLVRVAIGDSTCNACHHMVYTGRPSMKV
jgi:hypothetical protein